MTRRALLAAALGALAAACTSNPETTETIGLRQPAALAVFRGYTLDDGGAAVRPYLAVANAARNDLTLIDATDDTAVWAPVRLRAAVIPVAERPALLASAPLGDAGDTPELTGDDQPDLLVAVAAGDTVLQVVTTWDPGNAVLSDPATDPIPPGATVPLAVDLGADVLALAAVPSAPGTARVAAALADGRVAVVAYARADAGAIVRSGPPAYSAVLPFQPIALAAAPDDPELAGVQTEIYAATRDELVPGATPPVYGAAKLSDDLATVTPLRARGPTRLVAAARLRERRPDATAKDRTAFDEALPLEARVYAVLDESGCGRDEAIDCGVVTIAPEKTPVDAADDHIPDDWAGRMPYRAPIPIPGRPLAIAAAQPPALPPGEGELAVYADAYMRLHAGAVPLATTAVGAVASDDGNVYFLDLGRFKALTAASTLATVRASVAAPTPTAVDGTEVERRLWLQPRGSTAGEFAVDDPATAAEALGTAPGWARSSSWSVIWQGTLPSLAGRFAEAARDGTGRFIALQVADGAGAERRVSQVVKVWHPAFGVQATDGAGPGDVVQIAAASIDGCAEALAAAWRSTPDASPPGFLDFRVEALLPPAPEFPGGALRLGADPEAPVPAEEPPETADPKIAAWNGCLAALGATDARVTATVRARGLLLTGSAVGYAGRPDFEVPYELAYPPEQEDAAVAACPLLGWDGTWPLADPAFGACDAACRAACERAVLARKARRAHNAFEDCTYDTTVLSEADCTARWTGVALPQGDVAGRAGPAIAFQVGVQERPAGTTAWTRADPAAAALRDLALALTTTGSDTPLAASPSPDASPSRASGAVAFDRSPWSATAGYRFLVPYTGDLAFDTSPQANPPDRVVIR